MKQLAVILLCLAPLAATALPRASVATGNWNQVGPTIWSTVCGGAAGSSVPGAADDVTICNATTVTVSAAQLANTVVISAGGTLTFSGTNTLTIDNTPAITLNGGTFTAGSGTVVLNRDNTTTVVAGSSASITFNNLTFNPTLGGARVYTLGAGSIASIAVNGDFDIVPPNVAGAVRSLSVVRGTVTSLAVTGRTRVVALGAGNDSTSLNTTGVTSFTSGTLVLGDAAGGTGTNTLTAGAAAITLNGAAGPLFTRTANGVFTAGTSTVTMNSATSVALTSGTFLTTNAFNSLTVTMAGQTGTLGADVTVNNTLTIATSNTTLADGGNTITANGDVANSGTHSGAGKIALTSGSTAHTLSGTGTYGNLELNDANGATLAAAATPTISGILTLTSGIMDGSTNSRTVITSASCPGSVVRDGITSTGWVFGNLQIAIPVGTPNCTSPIGDSATNYTPIQLDFSAVTSAGSLTASVTAEDHRNSTAGTSGVDAAKSVNRYWTLANSTLAGTYTARFTYVPGDNDGAGFANYRVRRGSTCSGTGASRTCTPWGSLNILGTPTNTITDASGITISADGPAEADFSIGEADPSTNFLREKQFIYTREVY